ncbi:translation initiation factor IF-2 [Candidatus Wolfebacteria bacterium]|nr:MAG: translation initiation factor IF-2 [Candidatus Wolfebacteria bacterium]
MTDKTTHNQTTAIERPPIVAVMGHVDHGKSSLLDYIRKTNVVEGEAGGITQHISAYEVSHKESSGTEKKITFLDTPGHAAFTQMRERGAYIADIAILIVSAEDSVKTQTLEAFEAIQGSGIPYIVAINKIDKPNANVEKTKSDLAEKEIYLEGFGGKIPFAEISAKTGKGVDELIDLILLVAELEELKGEPSANATGFVIESDVDTQRGITASLVIKDGTLKKGMFIVVDDAYSGTRIFENFKGEIIEEATFSSPIKVIGFSTSLKFAGLTRVPKIGAKFESFQTHDEAKKALEHFREAGEDTSAARDVHKNDPNKKYIPLVIKGDVSGTIEAIEKEVKKMGGDTIAYKIIKSGVGSINESDIKSASTDKNSLIIGFNVAIDSIARDVNEKFKVTIKTSNVIYEITEWLADELEKKRPREEVEEIKGKGKVLKFFSKVKDKQVIGLRITEGTFSVGTSVKIIRRETELDRGRIIGIQQAKSEVKEASEGSEAGLQVQSKTEIAPGDVLESFIVVTK